MGFSAHAGWLEFEYRREKHRVQEHPEKARGPLPLNALGRAKILPSFVGELVVLAFSVGTRHTCSSGVTSGAVIGLLGDEPPARHASPFDPVESLCAGYAMQSIVGSLGRERIACVPLTTLNGHRHAQP